MTQKFYVCPFCGNIIAMVKPSSQKVVCCGKPMKELIPNSVDATQEKHVPVIKRNGTNVTVRVGSSEHPMTSDHSIEWIFLETSKGNQRKCLKPGDKPEACFSVCEEEDIISAMAYCNQHGLWKTDKLCCKK